MKKTFPDAQSTCQSMEANLASIHDQEEQEFIRGNNESFIQNILCYNRTTSCEQLQCTAAF